MASTTSRAPARDQTINIRTSREKRDLIDRAEKVQGKTRTEFILDVAYREATDVVLDQTDFYLDDETYDRFVELLDNPPPPTDALRRLLTTKAPWE